jgi:hypothetical protein
MQSIGALQTIFLLQGTIFSTLFTGLLYFLNGIFSAKAITFFYQHRCLACRCAFVAKRPFFFLKASLLREQRLFLFSLLKGSLSFVKQMSFPAPFIA